MDLALEALAVTGLEGDRHAVEEGGPVPAIVNGGAGRTRFFARHITVGNSYALRLAHLGNGETEVNEIIDIWGIPFRIDGFEGKGSKSFGP